MTLRRVNYRKLPDGSLEWIKPADRVGVSPAGSVSPSRMLPGSQKDTSERVDERVEESQMGGES